MKLCAEEGNLQARNMLALAAFRPRALSSQCCNAIDGQGKAVGHDAGDDDLSDRYTDKPFLRFVDAYVLRAIGHLDEATDSYCAAMVPQLRKSFGEADGGWVEIVERQMKFPPQLQDQIRKIWEDGKARFQEGNGEPPDPVQFAMIFVDRNFGRA